MQTSRISVAEFARIPCFALAVLLVVVPGLLSAQEKPAPRVRPDSKTNKVIEALEQEYAANGFKDGWAFQLKALIDLGADAVPDIIAELDATDRDIMLRNLGFAARAIGDKRVVPALIRALPKTLLKPGSDMGLQNDDPELMAFMRKHDLDPDDRRDTHYSFGRPIREIGGALQKLTGAKHDEDQINGVFLQGGPHQQRMQKLLYRRCADHWAAWWSQNWQKHVSDKEYASVGLPNSDVTAGQTFPQGPTVKIGGDSRGHIAEPDGNPAAKYEVFYDLDTGRRTTLPPELAALKDDPHRMDRIQAWAAREGFDLMGTYYQPAAGKSPHPAIRGLGLTAWEIGVDRYRSLDSEITKLEPLPIGQPAGGLLLHYDAQSGEYDPVATAAFLFVTREGTYGALFVGVEVVDTNVKVGVPVQGEEALNPVGFYKGRRFDVKIVEPAEETETK